MGTDPEPHMQRGEKGKGEAERGGKREEGEEGRREKKF